jgi:hypothetical protein
MNKREMRECIQQVVFVLSTFKKRLVDVLRHTIR